VPAATNTRTHYDVLGVGRDADAEEIRRAWKVLVQEWHPDRFGGDDAQRGEAEERTQRINEAWSTLRDSDRRSVYDRRIDAEREAQRPAPRRSGFSSSPFGATTAASTPASWAAANPTAARTVPSGPPPTLAQQLETFWHEFVLAAKRYPKLTMTVAAVWLTVFGGALVEHVAFGPKLPANVETAIRAAPATDARATHLRHLREVMPPAEQELPSDAELGLDDSGGASAQSAAPTPDAAPDANPQAGAPGTDAAPPAATTATPDVPQRAPRILRIHPQTTRAGATVPRAG
jgi:hypothetical protein